eukprot:gene5618-4037_t
MVSVRLAAWGLAGACGAAAAYGCHLSALALAHDPGASSAAAVREEEYSRRPCEVLRGWDVVVRNYYIPAPPPTAPHEGLHAWLTGLFADGQQRRLRPPPAPEALPPRLSNDNSVAPLLCSEDWPRGTQKYSALVLEPSDGAASQWLDGCTDQSVIRCDALGRRTALNCTNSGASLETPYLRVMAAALAWLPPRPPPLRVAILGVGGGALPAFLQRFGGRLVERMDLVDVEPGCFTAALEDLGLDEALNIVPPRRGADSGDGGVFLYAMDAAEFLRQGSWSSTATPALGPLRDDRIRTRIGPESAGAYDLLLVDLFKGSTLCGDVTRRSFLELCHARLSTNGVAAFNLPRRLRDFEQQCHAVFGGPSHVFSLPVPHSSNRVVVVCKGRAAAASHRTLWQRARVVTRTLELPFPAEQQLPIWWRFW